MAKKSNNPTETAPAIIPNRNPTLVSTNHTSMARKNARSIPNRRIN